MVAPRPLLNANAVQAGASSRSSGPAAWSVDVFRGPAGLAGLADTWATILDRNERVRFCHWYGWMRAYLSALDDAPDSVRFFVLRDGDEPLAVLPLRLSRRRLFGVPVRCWHLPQHPHLPLADGVIARDVAGADVVAALLPALARAGGWDCVELAPLLAESPLSLSRSTIPAAIPAQVRHLKSCDQVDCSGGLDALRKRFSRNFRSNLNKARNKLAARQGVEFVSDFAAEGLQLAFATFLDLEASGWKGAEGSGTAIKLDERLVAFYRSLIEQPDVTVVINSLWVERQPVASQFCVLDDQTLYVLKLAYDETFARLAPGNMLLEHVIRKGAVSRKWHYINLVGDPPWFKAFRPDGQDVVAVWYCNERSAGGRWVRGMLRLRDRAAPHVRRLAAPLRRRLRRRRSPLSAA